MGNNSNNYYRMPLLMGAQWEGKTPNFLYRHTEIVALQYLTLDGPPDAEYPTISYNDSDIKKLWFAKTGVIQFGNATSYEIGQLNTLLDALKKLPVKHTKQALYFQGSAVLRYDLSRRLV